MVNVLASLGADLRGLVDVAVVELIGLHELVEQALAPEGEQP